MYVFGELMHILGGCSINVGLATCKFSWTTAFIHFCFIYQPFSRWLCQKCEHVRQAQLDDAPKVLPKGPKLMLIDIESCINSHFPVSQQWPSWFIFA